MNTTNDLITLNDAAQLLQLDSNILSNMIRNDEMAEYLHYELLDDALLYREAKDLWERDDTLKEIFLFFRDYFFDTLANADPDFDVCTSSGKHYEF